MELGAAVLNAFPEMKVDVHKPDVMLHVEIREKIYIYSDLEEGMLMARPAFRIDGKFYTNNDWNRAIREGRESSSLTKEEKRDIFMANLSFMMKYLKMMI